MPELQRWMFNPSELTIEKHPSGDLVMVDDAYAVISQLERRLDRVHLDQAKAVVAKVHQIAKMPDDTCQWKQMDDFDNSGTFETECGSMWGLEEGTPHGNQMAFCPMCGKKLIEELARNSDEEAAHAATS